MPEVTELTSLDNPRVKAVVRLREHRERRKTGLLVADGLRAVTRAAFAGLRALELYQCPTLPNGAAPLAAVGQDAGSGARRFAVSEPVMRKIAYGENPEGVLGVFEQPRWSLDDLAAHPPKPGEPDFFLVAVGTQKPGNLGAMVRTADAAGVAAVLVADEVVDAFNPNAIRASTGAVFTLPVVGAAADAIRSFLAQRGVRMIATTPEAECSYAGLDLTGPIAIAIGPEDAGLGPEWLNPGSGPDRGGRDHAPEVVPARIPMRGHTVDSLNASVAAAVVLFEALRQRTAKA